MAKNKPAKAAELHSDESGLGLGEPPDNPQSAIRNPHYGPEAADNLESRDDAELSRELHGDNALPLVAAPRGNQGDDNRPYCARHNVLMVSYGSRPLHTDYKCPVDGCDAREKRVRPQVKVPAQPQVCPQRTCDGVALEVVPKLSNLAQLHMQCPQCGFNVKAPRPQFGPQLARQRQRGAVEDLAAR